MAKVIKRGNSYQLDYIDPLGKRIRISFDIKKDADAELAKRVSLIAEGRYLDVKKECKTTLKDLIKDYEENFKSQASFKNWKKLCLNNFKAYFGEDTLLSNIKYVHLEKYRTHLKEKLTKKKTIRTEAATNREISCLHHLFSKGKEWELIELNPFDRGKSMFMKENNQKLRFLSQDEIQALINVSPDHLKNIIICAVNTGMRRGEISGLRWEQITNGFIYLEKTKTNEPRQIPINDDLSELFNRLKKQNHGSNYVFQYTANAKGFKKSDKVIALVVDNEKRLNNIKHSWATALKKSGIEHCTMHSLRHTFASHLCMNGAGLKDVQELLGHKDIKMTLRYSHLSAEHKKKAVNLLNGLTAPGKSSMSQNVTNGQILTSDAQVPEAILLKSVGNLGRGEWI